MIEVLISIFVLLIGIVGTMGLFINSLKNSMDARDNVIATQLAQEGIELVRNIRDTNLAVGKPAFDTGTGLPAFNLSPSCSISYGDTTINCSSATFPLYISAGGYYTHTAGGTATKFKRQIIVDTKTANQLTVTSEVIWLGASGSFPAVASCTTANKCIAAKVTLITK